MFYINEENLGNEGTEGQARHIVKVLQKRGWDVEYGDSFLCDEVSDSQQAEFDAEFYTVLEFAISQHLSLQRSRQ